MSRFYRCSPLKLGVEISGIDLREPVSPEAVQDIIADSHRYGLLVFRNQGRIEGARQVEIAKWFGELDSEPFYKHPKSPCYDIFRVSNLEAEGCRNVGRTGWHIDGSFRERPYSHSIYHMYQVPKQGDTRFVSMASIVGSLPMEQKKRWDRLWMVSDRHWTIIHPLLYSHPITKQPALCFHLGMVECFLWDKNSEEERYTKAEETEHIVNEIHQVIVKNDEELIYAHKWREGDLIVSDNLAVAHEASPQTQDPVQNVGLRILHRVTVAGRHELEK